MSHIKLFQELLAEALLLVRSTRSAFASARDSSGIGLGERAVLQALEEQDGNTVPQIARAAYSSRQNVQVVVNRLVTKGLIRLAVNPDHRKSALVQITEEGSKRLAEAGRNSDNRLQAMLAALEESELEQAIECLRRARDLITGNAGPVPPAGAIKSETAVVALQEEKMRLQHEPTKAKSRENQQEDDAELPVNLL